MVAGVAEECAAMSFHDRWHASTVVLFVNVAPWCEVDSPAH